MYLADEMIINKNKQVMPRCVDSSADPDYYQLEALPIR